MELKGILTAIVTPFKDGKVDESALKRLIEFQIINGVDGIVPCGTTGEASTLSYEEHEKVIEITVKEVGGRIPVVAGTGSNSTEEAIELTEKAKRIGADFCLLTTPYYNRPTQEGLYRHFRKVAESVDIPLILYNIPSRTGVNLLPETVARLSEVPNIVGIKEASGSLSQVVEIDRLTKGNFVVLSGDDALFLPMMSVGGKGVISVASNIIPREMKELFSLFFHKKDIEGAKNLNRHLFPLFQVLFIETNPIPVKESLYFMGMMEKEMRLPLCPLSEANREKLKGILKEYGLLKRE